MVTSNPTTASGPPAAPRWQQLLAEHPLDASAVNVAILADAGEPAYRQTLNRWNALRDGDDKDAVAAIAVMLADAFDDPRGYADIAATWPDVFPEQLAWRCALAEPSRLMRRTFGAKALAALEAWAQQGTVEELPTPACAAARILAPADRDELYLATRRVLLERANTHALAHPEAQDVVDAAERCADDLLIAAAKAHPDDPLTARTVLSYWGLERPVDSVPTAHPRPGELPASWAATCELLAATTLVPVQDALLEQLDPDELTPQELHDYLDALRRSPAESADARLLELAKRGNGQAVRALARRRRTLAKAAPPLLPRVNTLIDGLLANGILLETPGDRARTALAQERTDEEGAQDAAAAIAAAYGQTPGGDRTLEWAAFTTWLDETNLPDPAPVPPPAPPGSRRGLFGRRRT